ncbi:MAG TPA: hypothetical protein VGH79_04505 [Gaiellaceae bacterium]|jgi:hypothetical protein
MESFSDSPEEIFEAYLLLQDAAESAALDAQAVKPTTDRFYKLFSFVAIGYLLLDLLSRRIPGPAHWAGLDEHVQLFHRIASLL